MKKSSGLILSLFFLGCGPKATTPTAAEPPPPAVEGESEGEGEVDAGTTVEIDAGVEATADAGVTITIQLDAGAIIVTPPSDAGTTHSTCTGGPKFDPAGAPHVGNGHGQQFIGGQCLSKADCASGCCAGPCGICSGPGAQFQAGKTGCSNSTF